MIHKIDIENFQSHPKTELNLSKGVNVLLGQSDSGKTAIIRALRWLAWNRPGGDAFRSSWGGETQVKITLDDGKEIIRQKGKENVYKHDGKEFKAFGADVPEEVQSALQLNDINLQQQLDRPFLLDNSPGEIAQHFNRVAHLEKIDQSRRNVEQWLKELTRTVQSKEEQLKEAEESLAEYNYLDKFEVDVEMLENIEKELFNTSSKINKITKSIEQIQRIDKELEEKEWITSLEMDVDHIIQLMEERQTIQSNVRNFSDLKEKIQKIDNDLEEKNVLVEAEAQVQALLDLYKELAGIQEKRKILKALFNQVEETDEKLQNMNESIEQKEKKFKESFPDICPLCNTPMQ